VDGFNVCEIEGVDVVDRDVQRDSCEINEDLGSSWLMYS
jgi:hypothetical protein